MERPGCSPFVPVRPELIYLGSGVCANVTAAAASNETLASCKNRVGTCKLPSVSIEEPRYYSETRFTKQRSGAKAGSVLERAFVYEAVRSLKGHLENPYTTHVEI